MRKLICLGVAVLAVALAARPALAAKAEDHPAGATSATHDAKADAAGGSKVNVVESFGLNRYDLGIYTLIVFGLLFWLLGKFAWGPMMKGLDQREATLRQAHTDANVARDEARKALDEVKARLAKTNDEIRAMLDEARRDAQVVKDQMKADAAAEATAERDRMRREIETAKDQAMKDIYEQSVMLAALVSTKAIKREMTPADHARLLDEALVDLKTNLGARA